MRRMCGFVLAATVAVSLASGAFAAPTEFMVQFVDANGAPYGNCAVAVYDAEENLLQKIPAYGGDVYSIVAEKNSKLIFEIFDEVSGMMRTETFIPNVFIEPLPITVDGPMDPQGGQPNDLCDNAIPVVVGSTTAGSTVGATTDDPPAPDCIGFPSGSGTITSPGVWYEFTGTGTLVTADLCNGATNYDSKLNAYCMDCEDLECVDGNDDACGLQSQLDFCTQAGNTYRVLVHGFGGQTGPFELSLTDSGVPCEAPVDCTPPEPEGACCSCDAPPYNCSVTSATGCLEQGGQYLGDDTACIASGGEPYVYMSSPGLPIPDSNPAGVSDTIVVGDAFSVGDVNVDVTIDHTFIGDLIITLSHGGTTVQLWDRACSFENDMDVTLDDEGMPLTCAQPTTGIFTPLSADGEALSALDSMGSAGDWTLNVSDNAGLDLGTLVSWGLTIESGTPACPDQNNSSCYLCEGGGDPDDGNVTLCHIPPGNPSNAHTIIVGQPAVPSHLAHGDVLGACQDDYDGDRALEILSGTTGSGLIDLMSEPFTGNNEPNDPDAEELDEDARERSTPTKRTRRSGR